MALLADNLYIIVQYSKDEFVGKPSYSQTILSFLRIYHFVKNINLLCIDCCANNKILNILNEEKFKNENNSILEEKMDNSLKFGQTNSDILISSLMKILCKINKRANEDAQNQIILFTETDFSNFSYFARCKMTSCFQTAIELKNAKIDIVLFPNRNNVLEVPRYVKEGTEMTGGNVCCLKTKTAKNENLQILVFSLIKSDNLTFDQFDPNESTTKCICHFEPCAEKVFLCPCCLAIHCRKFANCFVCGKSKIL